jgi:hypothetical protein
MCLAYRDLKLKSKELHDSNSQLLEKAQVNRNFLRPYVSCQSVLRPVFKGEVGRNFESRLKMPRRHCKVVMKFCRRLENPFKPV